MPGSHKIDHVSLEVENLEEAADFYDNVLGLAEITRENGTIYYGCGLDRNYDLAVSEGTQGVEHVAVRVDDAALLDEYEERLADHDVAAERTDGAEPGQEHGLRTELPSQLPLELVTVEDKKYKHSDEMAVAGRGGLAPVDMNHFTYLSPMPREDAKLMQDILDFKVSEAVFEDWSGGAFLRRGDLHHDIAIFDMPGTPENHAAHHHAAFTVRSVDHMVQLIDRVRQHDIYLEFGIGRHYGGDNIYAYFQAPDGHRVELNTQMAELDDDTPTRIVESVADAVTAWRGNLEMPESFLHGSGLAN